MWNMWQRRRWWRRKTSIRTFHDVCFQVLLGYPFYTIISTKHLFIKSRAEVTSGIRRPIMSMMLELDLWFQRTALSRQISESFHPIYFRSTEVILCVDFFILYDNSTNRRSFTHHSLVAWHDRACLTQQLISSEKQKVRNFIFFGKYDRKYYVCTRVFSPYKQVAWWRISICWERILYSAIQIPHLHTVTVEKRQWKKFWHQFFQLWVSCIIDKRFRLPDCHFGRLSVECNFLKFRHFVQFFENADAEKPDGISFFS